MFPMEPPQTLEAASAAFTALTDAVWVLGAAVGVVRRGSQEAYAGDDPQARVLAAAGFLVEADDGYRPAPGFAELIRHAGPARADAAESVLGQVLAVMRGRSLDGGWAEQDDDTLLAQGAASGHFLKMLLPLLLGQLPELGEQLRRAGAQVLDVGVGVGAMACAVAQAFPTVSIVGIDPLPRALQLAQRRVTEMGLEDRITLRQCGVEALPDQDAFDLVWIPAPFVPRPAFLAGLANLYRALRPGGWILVGMGRLEGAGVSVEVTRWQTALMGGTPLTPQDAREVLTQAGFTGVAVLDTPAGAPRAIAARRPS